MKLTEQRWENAWEKLQFSQKKLNLKKVESFIDNYSLGGCKKDILNILKELIPLFSLSKKERSVVAMVSSTHAHFANKKYLEKLKNLRSLIDEFDSFFKLYGWETSKFENDLSFMIEEMGRKDGIKRSHLHEVKNCLVELYSLLNVAGFKPSEQDGFVYSLFCEFEFDDYGKGTEDYIQVDGEITEIEIMQHENVKKIRLSCKDRGFIM